ncbi:MAG: O-antigen ligase family protein, partial [Anaerolineae bacterium]|nr:O-antigen ligase family protein [Anaerolineae bacterium]
TVDGQPANALPLDEDGRAYVVLYDPLHGEDTVTLARGLPDGVHEVELVAEGGWGQWALRGWSVVRERPGWAEPRVVPALGGGVAFCLLALAFIAWPYVERWTRGAAGRLVAWAVATAGSEAEASGLAWPTWLAWVLCGGVYFFAPWMPLGAVGLAGILPLTWIRPDLGLALVAFGIPFFLWKKPLGGFAFSSLELLFAAVVAVLLCRGVVRFFQDLRERMQGGRHWVFALADVVTQGWNEVRARWKAMDTGMLLLVLAGALSSAFAEVQGVAWHEFRVVILESAIFYFLLRWRSRGLARAWVWRVADAWLLAGVLLSLWGLGQYFLGMDVIEAEGVRRVRALYGSPNNLALFLERLAPLAAAYVVWGRRDWRKACYSAALAVCMLGLYLTFSRGAWLLALPVAFLVLGGLGGRRGLLAAAGALAAMAVALVPLAGTPRLQSLLDLQGSTAFFRLQLWESAGNMVLEHPFLGVGPDNFLYLYRTRYVLPSAWQELNLSHPHNALLDFWTRTGLLGLAAFVTTVATFFHRARNLWQRASDPDTRALAAGLLASMAGALAHGLIDNIFFLVDLAFVYALTMALTIWLWEKENVSACAS